MQTFLSLLRGINVSGQKSIKMADLKKLYELAGFSNVKTYIQSGNVIFATEESDRSVLIHKIKTFLLDKYNFDVVVFILSSDELSQLIEESPFSMDQIENKKSVLVTLIDKQPDDGAINKLMDKKDESEELKQIKNRIYLYCPKGYGKTKLSNTFIERSLNTQATTRNWTTILKLNEMIREK